MPTLSGPFAPLISPHALSKLIAGAANDLVIADCSFDLANPEFGHAHYQQEHIPRAIYVHLDRDLCGPKTGRNGRHPLPEQEQFAERLRELGIGNQTRVVAYDNAGGPYAARLWWLLRWVGHDQAALLDGGLAAWREAGFNTAHELTPLSTSRQSFFVGPARGVRTVSFADVLENITSPHALVVDARSPDRFRGENETIDPVGGHIPAAVNRFFRDNLDAAGKFKRPGQLREEFSSILGNWNFTQVIHQCGSGVTACHNLFALEIAGLGGGALYPGSWSEWVAHASAPIARG
ncbi:sulfurtransferase [Azonexus fungiphilus]|uniref:sulfurtransferase n=1 Tax=Azonexus fungiphilus TaxID=146940 RepID=UPI00156B3B65|nr:sulfurtransferase [Azonexus fungiphilus]NHC05234.1 sulfurtransferase [Azonexus fungiphilus]